MAPQGAPVSPVLANLFLHYAFDTWMTREFPTIWFERYADDAVLHCVTERQARQVLAALRDRLVEVGLQLHPDKTRIVYCKDTNRRGSYEHTAFTFLGYTFRPRRGRNRHGKQYVSFTPAVSKDALKKISREVRSWQLHRRTDLSFQELARRINPVVAGWVNYYGRFRPWELHPLLMRINAYLVRWIRQKYKRLAAKRKAIAKMREIALRHPHMFAHWRHATAPASAW
ncbi:reverse transcriptase domain-containing protein [Streptomyces luteireticuli]|uniref:reverse transcriptase domain-containing protein n=1 Tax=Streptomyces luteireticuli TaxID=173858 RepID=UPI003556FFA1